MKKKSIIGICIFIFMIASGALLFQMRSMTRHLTDTPPQEIVLNPGSNNFKFRVVSGSYLFRIGTAGMAPAPFHFSVKGKIITPSGEQLIDETYKPTEEILSKKVDGGYIARYIDIKERKGFVIVQLEVMTPEKETLVCLFHGIK